MLNCKLDDEEFDDRASAMNHLRDAHSELIDDELFEFLPEAEEIVFEEQIEEEE